MRFFSFFFAGCRFHFATLTSPVLSAAYLFLQAFAFR